MNSQEKKQMMRKQMIDRRNDVSEAEKKAFEHIALRHLCQNPHFQKAKTVMAYVDFRNEAPTGQLLREIIAQGKKLVLPLTDRAFHIIAFEIPISTDDGFDVSPGQNPFFKTSKLGILEPNPIYCPEAQLESIDFVLIPGVAFDRQGNRLGYGKGCYDEFLPRLRPDALKVGVAYPFQVLPSLPTESPDVKIDYLL